MKAVEKWHDGIQIPDKKQDKMVLIYLPESHGILDSIDGAPENLKAMKMHLLI